MSVVFFSGNILLENILIKIKFFVPPPGFFVPNPYGGYNPTVLICSQFNLT